MSDAKTTSDQRRTNVSSAERQSEQRYWSSNRDDRHGAVGRQPEAGPRDPDKSYWSSRGGGETKSYSTATYRKSSHSTSFNVLNVDGRGATGDGDRLAAASRSHHRKSVISSNTDLSNSVLWRKGDVTHVEAPHITSLAAAAQRKSINTLDSAFIVPAHDHRNTLSAMHRHERVVQQTNRSHISLGGDYSASSTSHYRNEYKPRVTGPCPVPLIERNQAPFTHTRDTKTHKFYKATDGDRK